MPNELGHEILPLCGGFMVYSGPPALDTNVGWYVDEAAAVRALRPFLPPPSPAQQLYDALCLIDKARIKDGGVNDAAVALDVAKAIKQAAAKYL